MTTKKEMTAFLNSKSACLLTLRQRAKIIKALNVK